MGLFSNTATIVAQASDPGPLGPGAFWSDTNQEVTYRRTDDNTQWVPVGAKVGDILFWGGTEANAPTGFAICDGTAISRTDFALLFDVIGTTFGIGNGSTTFNLPDLQTDNRFPRAATDDAGVGDTGGAATVTLSSSEMPAHTHTTQLAVDDTPDQVNTGRINLISVPTGQDTTPSGSTGGGLAHNNEPQFIDFHYIISTGL